MRPPRPAAPAVSILIPAAAWLLVLVVPVAPARAADPAAPARSGAVPSAAGDAERDLQRKLAGMLRNIWWNQDAVIVDLGLAASDRAAMDAVLERYLRAVAGAADARSDLREELAGALQALDADAVAKVRERLGAIDLERQKAQHEMMLEVLGRLTPARRAVVAERYPHLLRQPWVRTLRLGGRGG